MRHELIILFGSLISAFSCYEASNSETKGWFLTEDPTISKDLFTDKNIREEYEEVKGFLISNIFDDQWTVAYYVHGECNFNEQQLGELKQGIKDAVETWLRPIRAARDGHGGKQRIIRYEDINVEKVGEPDYHIVPTTRRTVTLVGDKLAVKRQKIDGEWAVRRKMVNKYTFSVFFYCNIRNPYIGKFDIGGGFAYFYNPRKNFQGLIGANIPGPEIHIYLPFGMAGLQALQDTVSPSELEKIMANPTPEAMEPWEAWSNGIVKTTLLNELGHLFGLGDTHYEGNEKIDKKLRSELRKAGYTNLAPVGKTIIDIHSTDKNNKNKLVELHPEDAVMAGKQIKGTGHNGFDGIFRDDEECIVKMFDRTSFQK